MASTIKIVVGILILIVGFPTLMGGAAVLVVNRVLTDDSGFFETEDIRIQDSNVSAIRFNIPVVDVDDTSMSLDIDLSKIIQLKINARDSGNGPIYIGLLPSAKADSFLSNVSYLLVTSINFDSGFYNTEFGFAEDLEISTVWNTTSGNLSPSSIPGASDFIFGDFSNPVNEKVYVPDLGELDQPTSLIIMNVVDNGSPDNVDVIFSVGAKIPILNGIGMVLVIFGGLFTLLGVVFIWSGVRSKPKPERVRYYYGAAAKPVEMPFKPVDKDITPTRRLQCSNCGAINEGDSNYCSQCGEIVLRSKESVSKKEYSWEAVDRPKDVLVVADWGQRFWAILIDWIIIGFVVQALQAVLFFGFNSWAVFDGFFFTFGPTSLVLFIYTLLMEYYYDGQTLGRMALNIKQVSEVSGAKPEMNQLVISAIGRAFFLPIDVIIGMISEDDNVIPQMKQRLTQKWAKTAVVQATKEDTQPEDVRFVSGKFN